MERIQPDGLHHITLVGADKATSMTFWEGVMGFPFLFEQPNLDQPNENHLYFEPGDGKLITVFTDETRLPTAGKTPQEPGAVHHIAFNMCRSEFFDALARLNAHKIQNSGVKDRGFMHSIYFREPLGLTIELATYVFDPPKGVTHSQVLVRAFEIRQDSGATAIEKSHVDQAVRELS